MNTGHQDSIAGEFIQGKNQKIVFKADGQEIELVSGMNIEAKIGAGETLVGRIGVRDDGLYFLGRRPMFAIPLSVLRGTKGSLQVQTLKKTA